ncbi:MAG TPA: tetratricopeptide repeat protein, partial [Burkholderiaceae bacterium]
SGGADLDAAAALVGARMPRATLLAAVRRLADQSLLVVRHGTGPARYHLLETVRQFAFERLQEDDHGPLLRERHVAHYLALAESCCGEFTRSGEGLGPWARIDAERDNMLRAADACTSNDVADAGATGLRLLAALRRYWTARGLANLGAEYSLLALDRARGLAPSLRYRQLLGSTVYMLWWTGRFDAALSRAHELEHLATAAGDTHTLVLAHLELGTIHRRLGDEALGRAYFEATCRMALEASDRHLYGDALVRLGHLAMQRGSFDEARRHFDDALPVRRESRYAWRSAGSLMYGGYTATRMGDAPRARELLREAAIVLRRVGSVQFELFMLDFAAALAALEKQWTPVVRLSGALHRLQPLTGPVLQDDAERQRQQALRQARAVLGAKAFDAAWARGTASDLAAALDFATRWLEAGAP